MPITGKSSSSPKYHIALLSSLQVTLKHPPWQPTAKPLSSPVCGRIGDKRCIAVEHYVECPTHAGSFHSTKAGCVKCAGALRRQEREALRDRESRDKENQRPDADAHAKKKKKKQPKKGRVKLAHEKTIKQVRRERKAARKSQASTCTEEGSMEEEEDEEKEGDGKRAEGGEWDEGVEL